MSQRRLVFVVAATLVVSFVATVPAAWNGQTGGWWEALRVTAAVAAATAVATQPRRTALALVAVWAVVSCPLPITAKRVELRGRQTGETVAHGVRIVNTYLGEPVHSDPHVVNDGAHLVRLGFLPVGITALARADKRFLSESDDHPTADLVAWNVGWLPWPHVQRTTIHSLGENIAVGAWREGPGLELRAEGHRLYVVGQRVVSPRIDEAPETRSEAQQFGLSPSVSWLTVAGWLAIGLLGLWRLWRGRRQPAKSAS